MTHGHAIVWLDHREATIIEFSASDQATTRIHGGAPEGKLHQKSGKPGSGHAPDDVHFFTELAKAIAAPEVLVVGPGTAKTAFERFVAAEHPAFAKRIVAVETLDHPSDGQLLAHGRQFFHRFDQMLSERHTSSTIAR